MLSVFTYSHAFFVHFSVSLFIVSLIAFLVSLLSKAYIAKSQSRMMARWGIWIASIMMFFTVVSGFVAFSLVDHDDLSHLTLVKHWMLSLIVLLMSIILGYWSYFLFKKEKEEGFFYLLMQIFAGGILLYATYIGTELVYKNGIGVSSLPEVESHDHVTAHSLKEDFESIINNFFHD